MAEAVKIAAQSGDSRNHWAVTLSDRDLQITGAPERLTSGAGSEGLGSVSTAAGAMRLAFSAVVSNYNQFELWVRDLITGRDVPLVSPPSPDNQLSRPMISMDGSKLAFSRRGGGGMTAATFVVDLNRAPDGTVRAGPLRQLPSAAKEGSGSPWGVVAGRDSVVVRPGAVAQVGAESSVRRCTGRARRRVRTSHARSLPSHLLPGPTMAGLLGASG
jgi:hypothetical protein